VAAHHGGGDHDDLDCSGARRLAAHRLEHTACAAKIPAPTMASTPMKAVWRTERLVPDVWLLTLVLPKTVRREGHRRSVRFRRVFRPFQVTTDPGKNQGRFAATPAQQKEDSMGWLKWGLAILFGSLLVIQVIPYGRDHSNPPVIAEPAWDSAETRKLAVRACYDCHSNETVWPWYSNVAPLSWMVQRDVEEGRETLNFSEWNRPQEGDESAETVREGSMPPGTYLLTHPDARLTDAELTALAEGLATNLGDEEGEGEEHEGDED